jgi:hypothetical protein
MRAAAMAFDQRLRTRITDEEIATLVGLLDRLHHNVTGRLDDLDDAATFDANERPGRPA